VSKRLITSWRISLPDHDYQSWIEQAVRKLGFCSNPTVALRRVKSEKRVAGCSKWLSSVAAAGVIFVLRVRRHMKRLVVSQSLIEVESLKELLSTDGILCTIRNQQGSSLAGEVPFVEVFPELWVVNDADVDRAKEILEGQASGDEVGRPMWICAGCGEKHVGLFTACWKCGRENDAKSDTRDGG